MLERTAKEFTDSNMASLLSVQIPARISARTARSASTASYFWLAPGFAPFSSVRVHKTPMLIGMPPCVLQRRCASLSVADATTNGRQRASVDIRWRTHATWDCKVRRVGEDANQDVRDHIMRPCVVVVTVPKSMSVASVLGVVRESGLVGRAFGELALERQRAARLGAVERGVAAVWVGSAETEDVSRLEYVLVGVLHLALAYRTTNSRSYERPAITEGG